MSVETIASPTGFWTKYLHWHVYKIYSVFYIENYIWYIYADMLAPAVPHVCYVPQVLIKF